MAPLHRTLTALFDQFVESVLEAVRGAGRDQVAQITRVMEDELQKVVHAVVAAEVRARGARRPPKAPAPKRPAPSPVRPAKRLRSRPPQAGEITDPAALLGEVPPVASPSPPPTPRSPRGVTARPRAEPAAVPVEATVRLRPGETVARSSGGGVVLRRAKRTS